MLNTQKFNRAKFNVASSKEAASATSYTTSHGSARATLTYSGKGELFANTNAVADCSKVVSALCNVVASKTDGNVTYINRIEIATWEAIAITSATVKTMGVYGVEFISLPNVVLEPGQELIIDTDEMTVTIDGENAMHLLSDDSEFFFLLQGENIITYSDNSESRNANLKVMRKDRWL